MKFKSYISIFLAVFLLISNTGMTIDVHYCKRNIASFKAAFWKNPKTLESSINNCCSKKSSSIAQKKERCCTNKLVHFQKKSGKVVLNSIHFSPDFVISFETKELGAFLYSFSIIKNKSNNYCFEGHSPPLFQLYQQYIFYA